MNEFIPGQRWISDADSQLGLGTILASDQRTVTILFLATGDTRTYAKATAPLTRVEFSAGDTVRSHDGWTLKINSINKKSGLLIYSGTREDGSKGELEENQLDNFIKLNRPTERLFSGQIDQSKLFELRYQTNLHAYQLAQSDLRGLTGARTSLIPHQLYIAHEVASRYAPRVLLADEVGLGKTIEAGLILHQQLLTERAKRILIVLPESLVYQWLVEMIRRFNLYFSIFDEERCRAIEESSEAGNPFHTEQLIICSLDFLHNENSRFHQATEGEWDILVVDEAHHLQWSPQQASPEYTLIEKLAIETKGVLLLTATPEQLGKAGHFARLRLLDPSRFPDYDAFIEEENTYEPITHAVEALLNNRAFTEKDCKTLQSMVAEGDNQHLLDTIQSTSASDNEKTIARQVLIDHLLDRHGTGRVLFRNTRSTVHGFPDRKVMTYPLALPQCYAECLKSYQDSAITNMQLLLCPELLYQDNSDSDLNHWTKLDPRVAWVIRQLKQLRPNKVLIITASAETAKDLAEALRIQAGIHSPIFHEGLSVVERDRAAAYFADQEYGSQALICSEIGSEGRNFQFAHHLILFDLPINPDLLEQRIGRLDRIGQTDTINIHVPYLENSGQAVMARWYQEGLNAFEHTCPAGHNVFVEVEAALTEAIHQIDTGPDDMTDLIETTRTMLQKLNEELHKGRDKLLEYNSCRPHIAYKLRDRALTLDAESTLFDYLENVFDCYGIETEDHREKSYIIRPGDHMQTTSFPGLHTEGMVITCDRNTALANEDIQFITWDHPLTTGAIDMILNSELGNTAVSTIKYNKTSPGTVLVECIYIVESASSNIFQTSRYFPPAIIRTLIDQYGNNHEMELSHKTISQLSEAVNKTTVSKIVRTYKKLLRKMVSMSEQAAQKQVPAIVEAAHGRAQQTLIMEIDRLKALRRINPTVRTEEIRFFEIQLEELLTIIDATNPRLDALKVIITT